MIKRGVIALPVTNRTAVAHLKDVVLLRGLADASVVLFVCAAASESATGC